MEYNCCISHLGFKVKDIEKTLHFYCDCLGLKKKFMMKNQVIVDLIQGAVKAHGMELPNETKSFLEKIRKIMTNLGLFMLRFLRGNYLNSFLIIIIKRGFKKAMKNYLRRADLGYTHLSLEVKDIKAAKEELISKGVRLLSDINLGPDNTYQFWIADPDQNLIELMEYTDKSLQILQ